MIAGIKKCIDEGDIKGLRLIFLDSLDVDPTFEKYLDDYSVCQSIEGMFEPYYELTPFSMVTTDWNMDYWDKVKFDQKKNFSKKRFEHMIEIAKVIHAEKIERLLVERAAKQVKIEEQIKNAIPQNTTKDMQPVNSERLTQEPNNSDKMVSNQIVIDGGSISDFDQARINENKRNLDLYNRQIEQEELEKKRQREARAREIARQNALQETHNPQKKSMGVVIAIIVVIVVVVLIYKVL